MENVLKTYIDVILIILAIWSNLTKGKRSNKNWKNGSLLTIWKHYTLVIKYILIKFFDLFRGQDDEIAQEPLIVSTSDEYSSSEEGDVSL